VVLDPSIGHQHPALQHAALDVDSRPRDIPRNAARGVLSCASRSSRRSSIYRYPTPAVGPQLAARPPTRDTTVFMHVGVVDRPVLVDVRASGVGSMSAFTTRWPRWATTCSAGSMHRFSEAEDRVSRGSRWLPYALERADRVGRSPKRVAELQAACSPSPPVELLYEPRVSAAFPGTAHGVNSLT